MFNDDQRDYMRSMAAVPLDKKCWCCWYMLGECPHCPPDKTGADKVAARCPDPKCHSAPEPNDPTGRITHTMGCSSRAIAAGKKEAV